MLKKKLLARSRESMTLPDERYRAVVQTEKFLKEILSTPRIPKAIKDRARSCLRHYPNAWDMDRAARGAPDVFQEQMEPLHRMVAAWNPEVSQPQDPHNN
jgi:hypothetical protein